MPEQKPAGVVQSLQAALQSAMQKKFVHGFACPHFIKGLFQGTLSATSPSELLALADVLHWRGSLRSRFGAPVSVVGTLHSRWVFRRRARILCEQFASLVPRRAAVLDVGCGDGTISAFLQSQRPDIRITGVDVLAREGAQIPVQTFDGLTIPFEDSTFDVVMFSDVLHHTTDPAALQAEACRVTRAYVLIKDHYREGFAARARLRFMDWVGNARFGVALPYNYWTEQQWQRAWSHLGLHPKHLITRIKLYPGPGNFLFGAKLHFIALLEKRSAPPAAYQ
jgi:SAM-dependent methyltransferase